MRFLLGKDEWRLGLGVGDARSLAKTGRVHLSKYELPFATSVFAEIKEFGEQYARQVIRNAQTLAKALSDHGFPVVCKGLGFTKSHQVFLDYGRYKKGRTIATRLEKANIIADCGVRLGTCEATRRGMKEEEMRQIAMLMKRVIRDNEKPTEVKKDATKLASEFQKVHYCFE